MAKKVIGRCMKCKENREIVDGKVVVMKNKGHAYRGKCNKCGTTVQRIISKSVAEELK